MKGEEVAMENLKIDTQSARFQEAMTRVSKLRREKALNEVEAKHLAKLLERQLEIDRNLEKLALGAKDDLKAMLNNTMEILSEDPDLPYVYLTYEYAYDECEEDEEIDFSYIEFKKRYYLTPRGILVVITSECEECNPVIFEISLDEFLEQIMNLGVQEIQYIADSLLDYYEKKARAERLESEEELIYIR